MGTMTKRNSALLIIPSTKFIADELAPLSQAIVPLHGDHEVSVVQARDVLSFLRARVLLAAGFVKSLGPKSPKGKVFPSNSNTS
jgi:hypothetical protein